MGKDKHDDYKQISFDALALRFHKHVPYDVFVLAPASQEILLFVGKGDPIRPEKLEALRGLPGNSIFLKVADYEHAVSPLRQLERFDAKDAFQKDLLGVAAQSVLKETFIGVLSRGSVDEESLELIQKMSDGMLKIVAPEVVDMRASLLKQLKNLHLMNHTAAICTMVTMVGIANEFRSRPILQAINLTCLVMDSALADLEEFELEAYYRDRTQLALHVWDKIRSHPVKSQLIAQKFPFCTELMSQIILTHHELHNGAGYHRGIRTTQILSGVFSLGVDLYEQLRGSILRGTPLSLVGALDLVSEVDREVHLRRHSTKVLQSFRSFLGL